MSNPLTSILKSKKYLYWDTVNPEDLSIESSFERILNFGDWEDVLNMFDKLTLEKSKIVFDKLANKQRTNLHPKTINYFKKYFEKYAP